MKKKIVSMLLVLCMAVGVCACSKEEDSNEIVSNDENITVEDETEYSEEENIQEEEEVPVWIPDDLGIVAKESIDFVAPAVHTEAKESCVFIWEHNEDAVVNWFNETFEHLDSATNIWIINSTGSDTFDSRSWSSYKDLADESRSMHLDIYSDGYSENYVSSVKFSSYSKSLQEVVDDATKLIEFMGFGNFVDDIIHNDGTIVIQTENGLGTYNINTRYTLNENTQAYEISVGIGYSDSDFTHEMRAYVPDKIEFWDEHYSLADFLPNSSFDTSSVDAFAEDEFNFTKNNIESTVYKTGEYKQLYNYTLNTETGQRENVGFDYSIIRENEEGKPCNFSLDYSTETRDMEELNIRCGADKVYDYTCYLPEHLTESDLEQLCKTNLELLKCIDSNNDFTVKEMLDRFKASELDEENNTRYEFECEKYDCAVFNSFDNLSLMFDFK